MPGGSSLNVHAKVEVVAIRVCERLDAPAGVLAPGLPRDVFDTEWAQNPLLCFAGHGRCSALIRLYQTPLHGAVRSRRSGDGPADPASSKWQPATPQSSPPRPRDSSPPEAGIIRDARRTERLVQIPPGHGRSSGPRAALSARGPTPLELMTHIEPGPGSSPEKLVGHLPPEPVASSFRRQVSEYLLTDSDGLAAHRSDRSRMSTDSVALQSRPTSRRPHCAPTRTSPSASHPSGTAR